MEQPEIGASLAALREELATIRVSVDNLLLAIEDGDAAIPALRAIQAAAQRAEFAAHLLLRIVE